MARAMSSAVMAILRNSAKRRQRGRQVGYESPSQFSREYARLFGAPPMRDVARLRASPDALAYA